MTPQENARRIEDLFRYEMTLLQHQANSAARLHIQTLIDYHNSLLEAGLKNVYQSLSTPDKLYSDVMNKQLKFLKDTQQELNRL